jgi:hypothetical protein
MIFRYRVRSCCAAGDTGLVLLFEGGTKYVSGIDLTGERYRTESRQVGMG